MTGQRRSEMSDCVCDLWSTEPWPLQLTPDDCKRAERVTATSQGASPGHGVRSEGGWVGGGGGRRAGRRRAGEGTGRAGPSRRSISAFPACLFLC